MADWQRTLRLQPEWGRAKCGHIEIHALAAVVAKRLAAVRPFKEPSIECERQELAERFSDLARAQNNDREEFDLLMEELYDWGDIALDDGWPRKKVCFIDHINNREYSLVQP